MDVLDLLMQLVSAVAGLTILVALFRDRLEHRLFDYIERCARWLVRLLYPQKLVNLVYPYAQITFLEFTGDGETLQRTEVFTAIQNYLKDRATAKARRLKADFLKNSQSVILTMDDEEEVTDIFRGVKLWWSSEKVPPQRMSLSMFPAFEDQRLFKLTFHKRHKFLITQEYIKYVMEEGKAIALRDRQRNLYTNNSSKRWHGWRVSKWSHVAFEHPATFDTLAMEPITKQEIINDLMKFRDGKEYYAKIGKHWKRGYLLHGPPGTGKSTMIAAMANFLNYDVYDLELTSVRDNSELRHLFIETTNKSIIVIEDIDCSLDLTGQRSKKKREVDEEDDPVKKMRKEEEEDAPSKVTLSGLLNFIDGIWSSCGTERIIIFTTNFVDKLDPALIRKGRMDKHIEMSYCCFEAFKVLANNYLDIQFHPLFVTIRQLLEVNHITPADVAENLMPKSDTDTVEVCLMRLIKALKTANRGVQAKSLGRRARQAISC